MSINPEDKQILEMFSQGGAQKEHAFRMLTSQYGEVLYRQIRRMTRNHEDTNDVLQNVFVKIFQNLTKFKQDSSLSTWLYRIARNETLNHLDKQKRKAVVDLYEPVFEIISGHNGLDTLDPDRIAELLDQAIQQLPDKQALVFQLKYFDELKYSEIASKLNTSEGALKATFHHAKQKIELFLRNALNQ
jgi:RNA polymerase sigma factor (sigma-70 family)